MRYYHEVDPSRKQQLDELRARALREEIARVQQLNKWNCALCKCPIDSKRVYRLNAKNYHFVCYGVQVARERPRAIHHHFQHPSRIGT